eukprot:CAMPEP_0196580920 /NCGR_PEP_ID=MMETSP1081-20130531/31526_1 /TAXON_ID=36882 /ORGANISM="Pyramimonas amylifera, Strain CCMP720" /LENGTH=307 /DNA_ID=CAMNT_0041900957 /DNA_START=75 /DNA_END=998 /DNA_ORIENTATION=-
MAISSLNLQHTCILKQKECQITCHSTRKYVKLLRRTSHSSFTTFLKADQDPQFIRLVQPSDFGNFTQPYSRLSVSAASNGELVREVLNSSQRMKLDTSDDSYFYTIPRIVTHVDEGFLAQLTKLYRERIAPGSSVLDLMSSWISHLPKDVKYGNVVGHGMNAVELSRNQQLDTFFVRDLNSSPGLAARDQTFDAVICCVSVQYLQYPEQIFQEIYRVLKPGGVCIVAFSNRLFYEKAVSAWRDGSGYSRVQLVKQYFGCVRGFTDPEVVTEVGTTPDKNLFASFMSMFKPSTSDPLYAVICYREFKP